MIARYKPGQPAIPGAPPLPQRDEPLAPRARLFLWVFGVAMVLIAGTAFAFKLIEFIHTATTSGSQSLASFLIPVLNYLIVAAGFMCLFVWAFLTGQFRDVEQIKYRMLEMQDEIDGKKRPNE